MQVVEFKYGERVERFDAEPGWVNRINMAKLKRELPTIFKFEDPFDVKELHLSYINKDGDTVALVDSEDLHDPCLNPLIITLDPKFYSEEAIPWEGSPPSPPPIVFGSGREGVDEELTRDLAISEILRKSGYDDSGRPDADYQAAKRRVDAEIKMYKRVPKDI